MLYALLALSLHLIVGSLGELSFRHSAFFGIGFFFLQAEDGIRDLIVTGVQTCALPIPRLNSSHKQKRHTRSDRDWSSDVDRKSTRLNSRTDQTGRAAGGGRV